MDTLAQGLLDEQKRVRELIIQYRDPILNGAGNLAAVFMEKALQEADKAVMSGDLSLMMIAFKNLKEFSD